MFKQGHPNRPIFNAWSAGWFMWAVSTDILMEYEEVIGRMSTAGYASQVFRAMAAVDALRQNMLRVSPSFHFHTVIHDRDDDKFADCAIAADADIIITEDKHFRSLVGSGYKPQPITPAEFIAKYL